MTTGLHARKIYLFYERPGSRDRVKLVNILESSCSRAALSQIELEMRVGKNGKRQVKLYDPDRTRVELMEAHSAEGKPVPGSTAPPPAPLAYD